MPTVSMSSLELMLIARALDEFAARAGAGPGSPGQQARDLAGRARQARQLLAGRLPGKSTRRW
jgi:hypothetical protein